MSKIGFTTSATKETSKEKDQVNTTTIEDFKHAVKFFGVPIYTSTKKHTIDSQQIGKID